MKETVAAPLALVVDVVAPSVPDPADHVTTLPATPTGLPFASASCAVIVTADPATGLTDELETRYLAGWAWKVTDPVEAIGLPPIVPLIVACPGVVEAVNVAA